MHEEGPPLDSVLVGVKPMTEEEIENEKHMTYGLGNMDRMMTDACEAGPSNTSLNNCVSTSDVSIYCADEVEIKDISEEDAECRRVDESHASSSSSSSSLCLPKDDVLALVSELETSKSKQVAVSLLKKLSESNEKVSGFKIRVPNTKTGRETKPKDFVAYPQVVSAFNRTNKSKSEQFCLITQSDKDKQRVIHKWDDKPEWKSSYPRRTYLCSHVNGPRLMNCFQCGKPGHFAANCVNRPYQPYYPQNLRTSMLEKMMTGEKQKQKQKQQVVFQGKQCNEPMKTEQSKVSNTKAPVTKPVINKWKVTRTPKQTYVSKGVSHKIKPEFIKKQVAKVKRANQPNGKAKAEQQVLKQKGVAQTKQLVYTKLKLEWTPVKKPTGKKVISPQKKSVFVNNSTTVLKPEKTTTWKPKVNIQNEKCVWIKGQPRRTISNLWYVDSGCSRHMTGDLSLLEDVEDFDGGGVSFAGGVGGRISKKGVVRSGNLSFSDVHYVEELSHSLLSVSQICDKDYSVMFNRKECIILKPGVKIPEECVLMRTPRRSNSYLLNMGNPPTSEEACLISKQNENLAMLWHRRLGHANMKNLTKLAKGEHVRKLPIKDFSTVEKCVACAKGKQHKLPHRPKIANSVSSVL
ncbi:hypothetical protein SSX86_003650 [Deinandra increscens subsp. villosa]|uniref:CCHC-type domain-containing protein n=1 Tax=Deinandra increscens subsp. villosa TaxID=3103831 RepID=A0AAP0H899_9ASTR